MPRRLLKKTDSPGRLDDPQTDFSLRSDWQADRCLRPDKFFGELYGKLTVCITACLIIITARLEKVTGVRKIFLAALVKQTVSLRSLVATRL